MRLLLDTHTLVWGIRASPLLSEPAREAIAQESSAVSVSVASAWEIAIKVGQGRWPEARELLESFEYATAEEGFHILPIAVSQVRTAGRCSRRIAIRSTGSSQRRLGLKA